MLYNLVQLGSVLDARRYRESTAEDPELLVEGNFVPSEATLQYQNAKIRGCHLRKWVCDHFQLSVLNADGSEPHDLASMPSLQTLSNQWISQVCKALIRHRVDAEQNGYMAQDASVTARKIREFIEADFADNNEFMEIWPKSDANVHFDHWLESWDDQWSEASKWGYGMPVVGSELIYRTVQI